MGNNIKVSVIVPIYGVEKYLKRALDSLISQTLEDIEIILVDDGSCDGCAQIIDEYVDKIDNIVALHKKNGGVSDARNAGIAAAQGEYIGFVDPDDFVDVLMFEKMYEKSRQTCEDLIICGYSEEFSEDNKQVVGLDVDKNGEISQVITALIDGNLGAYAWNKIYSRKIVERYNLRYPKGIVLSEDTIFFCKFLEYAEQYTIINDPLYHYIRNNESICAKYYNKQIEYYYLANESRISVIKSLGDEYRENLLRKNAESFLRTCLGILAQANSLGNKNNIKNRYAETKKLVYSPIMADALKTDYVGNLSNAERRKIKNIQKKRVHAIFLYEWWKMRVEARIRYYLE